MNKTPPAVKNAEEFITGRISAGTWKPGERLPSIRVLAVHAGVSLVTMWKAVRNLGEGGVLEVVHGRNMRVASGHNHDAGRLPDERLIPAVPSVRKWEAVGLRLRHDIFNGIFPPGILLPSIKELTARYGASFQSLRQALAWLVREHTLVSYKRTFKVPSYTRRRPGGYVAVFCRGEIDGDLDSWTPWGREFLRLLERECDRAGVGLHWYIYTRRGEDLVFVKPDGEVTGDILFDDAAFGFMVRSISEDNLHLDVLNRLEKYKKRIAVSDEGTCADVPPRFQHNPKIRVFSLATSSVAGKQVARFLLELGHRRVCFLSPFHSTCWSRNRLAGLQSSYRDAGIIDGIRAYTADRHGFPFGFVRQVTPDPDAYERLLRSVLPATVRDQTCIAGLRRKMDAHLVRSIEQEVLRETMLPFFREAAANEEVTAWVCVNDRIAVLAAEFLQAGGMLCGSRPVTLISFDNTFEAFNRNITSFNFNISALVRAMFAYAAFPAVHPSHRHKKPEIIEGRIVQRGTVKPVMK